MDVRRYRHILRPRRPVWSVKTIAVVALFVIALTAAPIYFFGHKSIFVETEFTLAAISAALFLFLFVGLYRGVRVRRRDVASLEFRTLGSDSFNGIDISVPDVDCPIDVDGGEGCLAALAVVFFWIIAIIVLLGLVWLLLNVGLWIGIALAPALTWMFYRALRQVFMHGKTCAGKLGSSLGYAALYTVLYTGWLFGAVMLVQNFLEVRGRGG